MLKLTRKARDQLAKVRHQGNRGNARLRFVPNPSGDGVSLTFAPEPKDGDSVVHADGMEVLVAAPVAERLDRSLIDVSEGVDGKPWLMLKRQPETSPWAEAA